MCVKTVQPLIRGTAVVVIVIEESFSLSSFQIMGLNLKWVAVGPEGFKVMTTVLFVVVLYGF